MFARRFVKLHPFDNSLEWSEPRRVCATRAALITTQSPGRLVDTVTGVYRTMYVALFLPHPLCHILNPLWSFADALAACRGKDGLIREPLEREDLGDDFVLR